jgi:hypothetical protein
MWRQQPRRAPPLPTSSCSSLAGNDPLTDQGTLELGYSAKDMDEQSTNRGRGIDRLSNAADAGTNGMQPLENHKQIRQATSQAVEFPDEQNLTALEASQAGLELRTTGNGTGLFLINPDCACLAQCAHLQICLLLCRGDPRISHHHFIFNSLTWQQCRRMVRRLRDTPRAIRPLSSLGGTCPAAALPRGGKVPFRPAPPPSAPNRSDGGLGGGANTWAERALFPCGRSPIPPAPFPGKGERQEPSERVLFKTPRPQKPNRKERPCKPST